MQVGDLVAYTSIFIASTLAPRPIMALLVARTLSKDFKGALAFALGISFGDVLIIILICVGLDTWLQANPALFNAAKYVALSYLLWLAHKIWASNTQSRKILAPKSNLITAGAAGLATCVVLGDLKSKQ